MTPKTQERWNWFLSANHSGKWIIVWGHALITKSTEGFSGTLYMPPDIAYHSIVARYEADEAGTLMEAEITSISNGDTFFLRGQVFDNTHYDGSTVETMILTDGITVLGFANGRLSPESNWTD